MFMQFDGRDKDGKSGYSPAAIDWRAINSARPEERKRIARKTRILLPLTEEVIRKHLTGKHTVGIYPLLPDVSPLAPWAEMQVRALRVPMSARRAQQRRPCLQIRGPQGGLDVDSAPILVLLFYIGFVPSGIGIEPIH